MSCTNDSTSSLGPALQAGWLHNRRHFLQGSGISIAAAALGSLFAREGQSSTRASGLPGLPHFPPTAKRVIYLCQSGAPSQIDLFDHKPKLQQWATQNLPDSIRDGQRLTGMTAAQASFPIAPSIFDFKQYGQSGAWVSELLPHTSGIVDDVTFVHSMFTEAINHDPAITLMQTGSQLAGRPSFGAWLSYGLGSINDDLPSFVALTSGETGQPLYDRLWGAGFLPSRHQGVKFRRTGDPVLYLSNPPGVTRRDRRQLLDHLKMLNQARLQQQGDPEIATRISQYEMAFRMQASVPELTDFSSEPEHVLKQYGDTVATPGSYASNCLLARRLAERGVRFIQLYHRGWDHHTFLPKGIKEQAAATDQPSAALLNDLKQRDMLKDTIVIWAGEFGRTVYCQGKLTEKDYGRDHHPRCFTIWIAGGGIAAGKVVGRTDDYSYNIQDEPVHIHDLNATLLHCLGIQHTQLTFKYQGRHHRLTDIAGNVMPQLLG
ncbi:MAG: DUF1501 domain-containing protein [Planctomycetota bacterium]|nr:DUF1501 domain-containing protein [Planctomycetota bacterium]